MLTSSNDPGRRPLLQAWLVRSETRCLVKSNWGGLLDRRNGLVFLIWLNIALRFPPQSGIHVFKRSRMMDPQLDQVAVALAVMGFVVVALWLIWFASSARLMRCPESGAVGFVDVEPVQLANGDAVRLGVRQCDLWPERQGCAHGCLSRYSGYSQTAPWYHVDLESLRSFERGSPCGLVRTRKGKVDHARPGDRPIS